MGLETSFFHKIHGLLIGLAQTRVRLTLFGGASGYIGTIFTASGTFAYGFYGWSEVLAGNLTLGSYLAFTGYVGYLYGPIANLIGLLEDIESTLVHTNRFLEIYNIKPAVRDEPELPELKKVQGRIEFRKVNFAYLPNRPVLNELDFTIEAQQTVAIVGRSGSGKSTIAKLIPRFYDPQDGQVLIDKVDLRQYQLHSLRKHIGFVMQGTVLFQGSISDNLSFGKTVPIMDLESATQTAHIHDFISQLPTGYDTIIGEQGTQLSEGQKQRIVLARALLQDTPILILDEPTTALDNESEYYIREAMNEICKDRTVIVIAHRLSTIRNADKIIVIDQGRVIEEGSHSHLILKEGAYARMYEQSARI